MGADSHRRQRALLVAAYLQSQSHASSRRQHGDKTQWFLAIFRTSKCTIHVWLPTCLTMWL